MGSVNFEILKWLASKDYWLQITAKKIIEKEPLTKTLISELTEILKGVNTNEVVESVKFDGFLNNKINEGDLRLISLGEIEGIDALAPRNALEFGAGNLTVIFGNNGSGKSGYTRILKRACGMPNSVELRPNVYNEKPKNQHCSIEYAINGINSKELWVSNSEAIDSLKSVDIFDSTSGEIYLDGESEVSYVPESVSLFEGLVSACGLIKEQLVNEKNTLLSKLPNFPPEYQETKAIKIFTTLSENTQDEMILSDFSWSEKNEEQLNHVNQRLRTTNPLVVAEKKGNNNKQLNLILDEIKLAEEKVNEDACMEIFSAQNTAFSKRETALEGAKVTTDTAQLEGVGSGTWVALWQAAKEYSKTAAYLEHEYPFTDNDALCVLCHQTLDTDAVARMKTFKVYVKSTLESDAKNAENTYKKLLGALPTKPSEESLCTKIQAAGLSEDKWLKPLIDVWNLILIKTEELKSKHLNKFKGIELDQSPVINELKKLTTSLKLEIVDHKEDAINFDRPKVEIQLRELKAKKWASSQLNAINEEVSRLQKISKYNSWVAKTHTSTISLQAGKISKAVITDAYINRFNIELERLGAQHIKVELVKTKVAKGKVKHQVRLQGQTAANINAPAVLSEGEHRIVTLAAFLADVTEKEYNASFIFDDPISSLDQPFEEKTIERLVHLSNDRQVIIFTHRLSFLSLITEMGTPHCIHIRREPWGTGEPGEIPIFGKQPIKAIKHLKNERLQQAKKIYSTDGFELYYPLAKSLCSDIRILVERIVELDFLADVIQRHRRAVHTLNKVDQLAKIIPEDCTFIEKLMTDYSGFEHSQSLEFPVEVPTPDEIESTLDSIIKWHTEFKNRTW